MMRILQLCKKFPYPLKDGESIAVSSMSRALKALGCEITLLAMNTSKHFTEIEHLPDDFNYYQEVHTIDVCNQVKPWPALKNIFSSDSYHISRFVSSEFEDKLKQILSTQRFDVVQLETLYLTPYLDTIKEHSDALVVMRAHNIESEIWERITENTQFLPKKIYLNHLTKKLKKYELEHLNAYDYLVTVSDRDLQEYKKLGYANGAMASPIGLHIDGYKAGNEEEKYDIGFIGTMDWKPNEEGVDWFVKEVMPLIKAQNPKAQFHIAGRNSQPFAKEWMREGVVVHGEVDSATDFMDRCKLMIVPLFSGSGTRVKILEAMAMKKPIVTTSIGLEGIDAIDGTHTIISDDALSFAESILSLLDNEDERERLGSNGYDYVIHHYDNITNAEKLLSKYKELLSSEKYTKKTVAAPSN